MKKIKITKIEGINTNHIPNCCHTNAYKYVMNHQDCMFVSGQLTNGLPHCIVKLPNDIYIDPTLNREEEFIIEDEYTFLEIMKIFIREGMYFVPTSYTLNKNNNIFIYKNKKKYYVKEIPNYQDYELHYSDDEQKVYSKKSGKYLKNNLDKDGYYHVTLCNEKGKKNYSLHRLVWYCINGDIPKGLEVNHLNENKTDNRIENLNLMSRKENINWGTRNQKCSEKMIGNNNRPKKTIVGINKQTYEIIEFISSMEAERQDKRFNNGNINQCCQHKTYKSVNGYYWFYQDEFNDLLIKFNGNIQDIIRYKIALY